MLPRDGYLQWSAEEREAFRCYRTDVSDTIMYCHNVLKDDLLKLLNHHLDEAVRLCQQDHARNWPYLETCMHAWSSLGESLAEEEENYLLLQFLAKLPSIPFNGQVDVISVTLDCIGGFAEWLGSYPNLVANLVPMVTSAVSEPTLSMSATMTLRDLARDCPDAMQPCARDVIAVCAAALSSGKLKEGETARIMYPVGRMIGFLPRGDMFNELKSLLEPYISELMDISRRQASPTAQDQTRVLHILKVLTTLFQAVDGSDAYGGRPESSDKSPSQQAVHQKETMSTMLQKIFPVVTSVCKPWLDQEQLMDSLHLFLKQMLVCLEGCGGVLASEVAQFVLTSFAEQPHPMAYDVTRILLLQFGNVQDFR